MTPITLQQTITHLETVARDEDAQLTTLIQLELNGGSQLTVFWQGPNDEDLPREAYLYHGEQGKEKDTFLWAWVMCPHRFLAATDEGLTDEEASHECRRFVESLSETVNYLTNKPYAYVTPKQVDTLA